MGKKYHLSDLDHGMIVDARQGGLSILISWDFHMQQTLEIRENGAKKTKTSPQWHLSGQKFLIKIIEVSGE